MDLLVVLGLVLNYFYGCFIMSNILLI